MRASTIRILGVCLGGAVLVAVFIGCSGDDDTTDATVPAAPSPDVCAQMNELEDAVAEMAELDVVAAGTDALNEAVDNVRAQTDALKETASAEVSDEVEALDSAVTDAEETVDSLDEAGSVNEKIDLIQSAFTPVLAAAAELRDALAPDCG